METYTEAYRYLDNAKEILRTKAKKDGKFYNDVKYVRMACNTAYSGLLVALNDFFIQIRNSDAKTKRKKKTSHKCRFLQTKSCKSK